VRVVSGPALKTSALHSDSTGQVLAARPIKGQPAAGSLGAGRRAHPEMCAPAVASRATLQRGAALTCPTVPDAILDQEYSSGG